MSPSFRRFAYKIKDNVILCQKVVWTRGARVNSPVQCCAYVCAKSLQSCLTLCKPMNHSPAGSSVNGILQARILEWVAIPSSRRSSQPRDRTCASSVSRIGRQILYHQSHLRSPQMERESMFIDRKTQYYQEVISSQLDL